MTIDDTTRLLRDLDAATGDVDPTRRTATLERILATGPEEAGVPVRRRVPRAWLVTGGVIAAATVAAVLVPLSGRTDQAFATWSPTPVELEGSSRAAAVRACLVLQGDDRGELAFDPQAPADVEVAEARGGWRYVLFTVTSDSGRLLRGSCLMPDDLVDRPRPGGGRFFGSLGDAADTGGPAPAVDAAREDVSAAGAIDDAAFAYAEGRAGRDVVDIEVTTPSGQHVEASVEDGHWAAWWPVGDDSPRNPDIAEAPTYRVTLRDGSVTGLSRLGSSG